MSFGGRPRLAAVLGALLVVAVALGSAGAGPDTETESLDEITPHGWGGKKPLGMRLTDGIIILVNIGKDPIKLLGVEQELTGDGLEPLGAYTAGVHRKQTVQQLHHFPPRPSVMGDVQPLAGAVIPPGKLGSTMGVELLLGYKLAEPGRATRRSVTLQYEVDGNEYERKIISTLAICTPKSYEGPCRMEYGDS